MSFHYRKEVISPEVSIVHNFVTFTLYSMWVWV